LTDRFHFVNALVVGLQLNSRKAFFRCACSVCERILKVCHELPHRDRAAQPVIAIFNEDSAAARERLDCLVGVGRSLPNLPGDAVCGDGLRREKREVYLCFEVVQAQVHQMLIS
jgi:hypothetical protein